MSLSESLREAMSQDDCPSPEEYLRLESGEATPEEGRRLLEHAERCPACAAEREMARLFHAGPEPGEDVDFVVERLESLRLHETPRPLEFRPRRKAAIVRWAGSLAALVALAVGLSVYTAQKAPPLPERGRAEVFRGAEIQDLQPSGEFPEVPRPFRWSAIEGAASYRVTLRAVDETVLWEEAVTQPSARLPEEVARGLHPAVLYTWTVEALNQRGERLAASEPVRFTVSRR